MMFGGFGSVHMSLEHWFWLGWKSCLLGLSKGNASPLSRRDLVLTDRMCFHCFNMFGKAPGVLKGEPALAARRVGGHGDVAW